MVKGKNDFEILQRWQSHNADIRHILMTQMYLWPDVMFHDLYEGKLIKVKVTGISLNFYVRAVSL